MTAHLSRRALIAGGGALIVSFSLRGAFAETPTPQLPGSLKTQPFLDAWIRISGDGKVTVFTGKAELGQGVKTAILQLAAEELDVDPHTVTIVTADTAETPDEGYTAGSQSMENSGVAVANAAAQVREILIGLAAARLNLPADALKTRNGSVMTADGRSVGYGELVDGEHLGVLEHHVVGRRALVDLPAQHDVDAVAR